MIRREIKKIGREIDERRKSQHVGTRERNFKGSENEKDIFCHFKIFLGHNCPSII